MRDEDRMNRYDFEAKSNRFMEFISREMMRNKNHKSHAENPKTKNNVSFIPYRAESSPTTPNPKPMLSIYLKYTHNHKSPSKDVEPVSLKVVQKAVIQTKA